MEQWAVIDEYPNYAVSDYGRVINVNTEYELKHSKLKGFSVVGLRRNNRQDIFYVHRLVADMFMDGSMTGRQVLHVNGDKNNNSRKNLRFGPNRAPLPGRRGRAVMVLETGDIFDSVVDCAKRLNGHPSGVYSVLSGKAWTYHGFHFKYVD